MGNCLNIERSDISTLNSIFRGNTKDGKIRNSGAFYCFACFSNFISNSNFELKQNFVNGAALFLISQFKTKFSLTENALSGIYNCSFSQNIAVNNGGAIYLENQLITINNSVFFDNEATKGGAIYNLIKGL